MPVTSLTHAPVSRSHPYERSQQEKASQLEDAMATSSSKSCMRGLVIELFDEMEVRIEFRISVRMSGSLQACYTHETVMATIVDKGFYDALCSGVTKILQDEWHRIVQY